MYYNKSLTYHLATDMNIWKRYLLIILFNMIVGNIAAQNENGQIDSICVSMTTPYSAGVKWNCSCIIHDKLVSVNISEFYRSLEIPSKKLIIPNRVIHRYYDLSTANDALFNIDEPLHLSLSNLVLDILKHRDDIRENHEEEIDSDTIWVVSTIKDGKTIDYFSVGNFERSRNSFQLSQLTTIMERILSIGRFSIMERIDKQ